MGMDPPRTCRCLGPGRPDLRANMSIKEVTVSLDAGKTAGEGRCRKASFFRKKRTSQKGIYIILSGGFKYFLFSPLFGEDSHFD